MLQFMYLAAIAVGMVTYPLQKFASIKMRTVGVVMNVSTLKKSSDLQQWERYESTSFANCGCVEA